MRQDTDASEQLQKMLTTFLKVTESYWECGPSFFVYATVALGLFPESCEEQDRRSFFLFRMLC